MSYNINTKLLAFDGVIGRRDYILNFVIICAIALFFSLPCTIWLMSNMVSYSDYFSLNKLFIQAPVFIKVWTLIGTIGLCICSVSNAFRRLNDINGREDKVINTIVLVLIIIYGFSYFLMTSLFYIMTVVCFIIQLILLFKQGKITSQLPYDPIKEFNWGAFFGTWMWGLFNKSYIPLFELILFLTPWGVLFQIYCGFKGNEWAFKNKKWRSIEKFNKSQEKQTIFWVIFSVVIMPVAIFAMSFLFGVYLYNLFSNPNNEESLKKIETTVTSMYFESYEIRMKTNSFYVNPKSWNRYSFDTKRQIMDYAAQMSAARKTKKNSERVQKQLEERRKLMASGNYDFENYPELPKTEFYSQYSELPKTKIYSSEDNQLLGEYITDENIQHENGNVFDVAKSLLDSYKFYKAE